MNLDERDDSANGFKFDQWNSLVKEENWKVRFFWIESFKRPIKLEYQVDIIKFKSSEIVDKYN